MTPDSALGLPQTYLLNPDRSVLTADQRSRSCLSHCCSDDRFWPRTQMDAALFIMLRMHADAPCSPFAL